MGSENVYFVQNHIFEVPLRAGRLAIPGLNIITMEVVEVTSNLTSTLKTLQYKFFEPIRDPMKRPVLNERSGNFIFCRVNQEFLNSLLFDNITFFLDSKVLFSMDS